MIFVLPDAFTGTRPLPNPGRARHHLYLAENTRIVRFNGNRPGSLPRKRGKGRAQELHRPGTVGGMRGRGLAFLVGDEHAVALFVRGADGDGVVIGAGAHVFEEIGHGARGDDDVVGDDDGAFAELRLDGLHVLEVVGLVGVDVDEVVLAFEFRQDGERVAGDDI